MNRLAFFVLTAGVNWDTEYNSQQGWNYPVNLSAVLNRWVRGQDTEIKTKKLKGKDLLTSWGTVYKLNPAPFSHEIGGARNRTSRLDISNLWKKGAFT